MRKYIVIRFNSIQEGIDFMSTYEYPSAFIVDNDIYDKSGNLTTYEVYVEMLSIDIRNVNDDQFLESEICYDGDNLFILKPE